MKKRHNIKTNSFRIEPTDPGLGFSPYQRDKGCAYRPMPTDLKRIERKKVKQNLKAGNFDV